MSAKIVAILQQKGGAGKTTVAIHVARGLQLKGRRVLIVDADAQRSAVDWRATQEAVAMPEVVAVTSSELDIRVRELAAGYDYLVVDGAPRMEARMAVAVAAADLVIIPTQTSAFDLRAAAQVVALVRARQAREKGKPAAALMVNRPVTGSRIASQVDDVLSGFGLPVMESRFGQRVAFMNAVTDGLTVFETDRGKARKEAFAVTEEVLRLLS